MNVTRFDTPADCIAFDPRLAHVDCMVAASHDEQFMLWQLYASDSRDRTRDFPGLSWRQDSMGRSTTIGVLDGRPIHVAWYFVVVEGAVLCFYEATSTVVDHDQVRAWSNAICPTHVNAANFHNRPRFDNMSPNVALYDAAGGNIRAERWARYESKAASDAERLAGMVRDPAVIAMIEAGIPEISDSLLADRATMVEPLVDRDGQLWHILPIGELRSVSFTWSEDWTRTMDSDLVPAKQVRTLHTFGYYGFFKPSIAEVLAQAPDDLHEYAAYSIEGPKDAVELRLYPEAIDAGYHVATVTYYRRKAA